MFAKDKQTAKKFSKGNRKGKGKMMRKVRRQEAATDSDSNSWKKGRE